MYARRIIRLAEARKSDSTSAESSSFTSRELQKSLDAKSIALSGVQIGNATLKFELDEGDEFYQRKAREELRESPEVIAKALQDIRELLKTEPELIVPDDDDYYRKFLRPCKWCADSAVAKMKRYYKFRLKYSHVCEDLLPSKEKNCFNSGTVCILPLRNDDGSRICLIEAGDRWNPKAVTLNEMFKCCMMMIDTSSSEPKTQISGIHVIFNMKGQKLSQVTYYTPSYAAMLTDWTQNCAPSRIKGFHIVNQPFIFNVVFAIFKPFLQQKTRNRIHFHGTDRASLTSYLSKKALPKSLDGDLPLEYDQIGEPTWKFYSAFDEDYKESNCYGYVGAK
ncbi:hypothetical protein KM043_009139 [Ampulex compressa]|nr:hypothetical protein KM043_009139 [Ampulex compressa]